MTTDVAGVHVCLPLHPNRLLFHHQANSSAWSSASLQPHPRQLLMERFRVSRAPGSAVSGTPARRPQRGLSSPELPRPRPATRMPARVITDTCIMAREVTSESLTNATYIWPVMPVLPPVHECRRVTRLSAWEQCGTGLLRSHPA